MHFTCINNRSIVAWLASCFLLDSPLLPSFTAMLCPTPRP
jgi:hypothetical protein